MPAYQIYSVLTYEIEFQHKTGTPLDDKDIELIAGRFDESVITEAVYSATTAAQLGNEVGGIFIGLLDTEGGLRYKVTTDYDDLGIYGLVYEFGYTASQVHFTWSGDMPEGVTL